VFVTSEIKLWVSLGAFWLDFLGFSLARKNWTRVEVIHTDNPTSLKRRGIYYGHKKSFIVEPAG
jgi:hypothetical protein